MEVNKLYQGDCLEVLKALQDNSVDCVVTDPPYGMSSKSVDIADVMRHWLDDKQYVHGGGGFMGKSWDSFVPSPIYWKEIFRVLKPGGHAFVFASTRTADLMGVSLRFAGFEIRNQISWVHSQGFPKSMDVSKAIDRLLGAEREVIGVSTNGSGAQPSKLENHGKGDTGIGYMDGSGKIFNITAPTSEEAKAWSGFGTDTKPAQEPILLVRKPLSESTVAKNVLKHGTGAINIDATRIPFSSPADKEESTVKNQHGDFNSNDGIRVPTKGIYSGDNRPPENYNPQKGRFPGNVILSHHPDCVKKGTKVVENNSHYPEMNVTGYGKNLGGDTGGKTEYIAEGERPGKEVVEDWICVENCVVRIMDEQSGILNKQGVSATDDKSGWQDSYVGGSGEVKAVPRQLYLDTGGASRFYMKCNYEDDDLLDIVPFFYCPKSSSSERNHGLAVKGTGSNTYNRKCLKCGKWERKQGFTDDYTCHCEEPEWDIPKGNIHPTVKPLSLMKYLIKMLTREGQIVLDPFCWLRHHPCGSHIGRKAICRNRNAR